MLRRLNVAKFCYAVVAATSFAGCSSGAGSVAPAVDNSASVSNTQSMSRQTVQSSGRNTLAGPTIATVLTETPRSAFSLVDSVGIVTHFHYDKTPYVTQYLAVRDLLIASHIHHIRDAITTATSFKPYFGYLAELATHGIHTDGVTQLNVPLSEITDFATALPGVLESIEAPNEWNLSGDPNWIANIRSYQQQLYAGVKSSPLIAALPVIGPSLTSFESYKALGDLSAYTDQGNMHNYFGARNPGNSGGAMFPPGRYGSIPFFMGSAALVSGAKPIVTTETGYEDLPSDPSPVSDSVKAKYTLRTILEHFNAHVTRTFFYELVDEGGQSYGFISPTLKPKPVYNAVSNLLYKLNDGAGPINLKPLTYTLSADPSVHHSLLQKSDGSYRLLLWIESAQTDPVAQSQTVTISTAAKFSVVDQYEYQDSGKNNAQKLAQAADGSITLTVSDRVSELKLQP